jgi:hypothetical protein
MNNIDTEPKKVNVPAETQLVNRQAATPTVPVLIARIRGHIERGVKAAEKSDEHFKAAGLLIKQLKEQRPHDWKAVVQVQCGLARSRAYELLRITDGRSSVEETRAHTAARVQRHATKNRPLANGLVDRRRHEGEAAVFATEPETDATISAEKRKEEYAETEHKEAVTAKDIGLHEFDGHVLRLLQKTAKAKPERFAKTGVPGSDLSKLSRFLADLAEAVGAAGIAS